MSIIIQQNWISLSYIYNFSLPMYTLLISWVRHILIWWDIITNNDFEDFIWWENLSPCHFLLLKDFSCVFQFHWTYHSITILQGLVFITWSEEFLSVFRLWIAFEKSLSYNYRQLNTCQVARKWNHVKFKDKYAMLVKHLSIKTVNAHF